MDRIGIILASSININKSYHIIAIHRDEVPILKDISQGPLPKDQIAEAYSSAQVVIAYTMDSQRDYGMINNRIFEALSCGAIVVSEAFPELEL
jgi:spore maturation protein CgeB